MRRRLSVVPPLAGLFTGMTKLRLRELWSGPEKLARAEHELNLAI